MLFMMFVLNSFWYQLCTLLLRPTLHSAALTRCSITCNNYTYTTHCTLNTTHNTLHTKHCTLHTTHYTLHTTHYTLHTTHYTLHTTHYTLHTTHYTQHTTHYTLHTTHARTIISLWTNDWSYTHEALSSSKALTKT